MAKTCPRCFTENTDTARFCSSCATSLGGAREASPSPMKTRESPLPELAPGTVIGAKYEILDKLGRGGMGEVYRAVDKRLERRVAVKVLPESFAADPERLARFRREAKLLAALNHSNIGAVHELEETGERHFLILELVEGETLQTRLERRPMAVGEALEACRQVAAGLEAAHEKGIVHRDLKPGNIMITPEGQVKILDFGLAKSQGGETTGVDIANSPTITALMTEPGVVLGTAAYMSPEQARGRAVDKRADIWAFGCVLYECLTGRRAFQGETASDVIAKILQGEPDWSALPAAAPATIRALLRRCLRKDRKERLHDIADARLEIEDARIADSGLTAQPRHVPVLAMAGTAAVILAAGVLIGRLLISPSSAKFPPSVVTSTIKVEPGHWLDGMRAPLEMERPSRTAMAISRDGTFIVYSAVEENPGPQAKARLFLRRLDRPEASLIAGTEGGINPFLSADDRWVGFWADGKLKKVPVEGGVATELCDVPWIFGASWGTRGIVYADKNSTGLSLIQAEGGRPETLTKPDPEREEASHRLPSWLPDGRGVLFTGMKHYRDPEPWLALFRLDTREWKVLIQNAADAKYLPTGHLVFLRQGTLMAVRFDLSKLEVAGQPSPLVENVMQAFGKDSEYNSSAGQFAVAIDSGSLIYATGGLVPQLKNSLIWVDHQGNEQLALDPPFPYMSPRLSPDGRRIVYALIARERQIYVYDLVTGSNFRLTAEGRAVRPIWTPDGKKILFALEKSLVQNLFLQPYDGSSQMERLTTSEYAQYPGSWSSDGKTVALVEVHPDSGNDIMILDVRAKRVTPFLNTKSDEQFPDFSPDGRWLAYSSDESGRAEVYVRAFPGPGMKLQVSSGGGAEPLWARNGRRLYYRRGNQLWAVDILTEGGFEAGRPRLLFEKPGYISLSPVRGYDLSLDGQRFLMVKLDQRKPTPATEMTLIQNWFEELKRLGPAK